MSGKRSLVVAASVVAVAIVVSVVALLKPGRAALPEVAWRIVRPDGQPIPTDEAGDNEVVLASGCGVERWPVKTGTDADRSRVSTSVVSTSIAALAARGKPSHYPTNNRIAPTELHVWQVTATVTQYKEEADSDIHLVLTDSARRSMIAEIPSPNCVGSTSRWRNNISSARAAWTHSYPVSTSWHHIHRSVTLNGLGFFDPPHGQTGAAQNGIELHPVIHVQLR